MSSSFRIHLPPVRRDDDLAAAHGEDAGVASPVAHTVNREVEFNRLAVQDSTRDKRKRTVVIHG